MIAFLARLLGSRFVYIPLLAAPAAYIWNQRAQDHLGAWKTADLQDFFGNTAISLLIFVLCLSPLRVLFPKSKIIAALNRHRRATGIASFLYAAWHFWIYLKHSEGTQAVFGELSSEVYLQAGLVTLVILAILAGTSNKVADWILGYRLWKLLHRIAYLAAVLAFFHRAFGVQKDSQLGSTLAMFAPLIVLEFLRVAKTSLGWISGSINDFSHRPAFTGWRKFRVARKVAENADITSIYLEPVDGRKLKPFHPGQFLTYEFPVPGQPDPVIRSYSISDSPNPKHYRSSIKRVPPPRQHPEYPPGLSSNYVHDQLKEGDILRLQAPAGSFTLDPKGRNPIVLLGSGIGLTPVFSMLKTLADHKSKREIWFFYGVRHRGEEALREEAKIAFAALPNAHTFRCHSDPEADEKPGTDHDAAERISVDLLKRTLPHNRYDFYFCGPGPMMESCYHGLLDWGVPEKKLHFEAFGPSSLKKSTLPEGVATSAKITFLQSKKTLQWEGGQGSILELAESRGMKLRFGCRGGACGTCKVRLRKGEVAYTTPPAANPGSGSCLICISLPKSDLEIDA